jgi:CO/xanthine dehydrogenase FAD-binding subunit
MAIRAVHVPDAARAVAALAADGGRIMAGGTVVMPLVNSGTLPETELISLRGAGLDGIEVVGGVGGVGGVERVARIGAATTFSAVEDHVELAFLRPALRTIGSPTIRNLASVGGNLFVERPYGDFAVCLLALDARCEVAGPGPGPGKTRHATVAEVLASGIADGEVLSAVSVELPDPATWYYHKAMRRRLNSASIVTVAAVVATDESGVVASARIALGGVAPRPIRAVSAERVLLGRPLERAVLDEAGAAARLDIEPADDAYASAWYRTRVLPVHLRRAFLG